MPDLRELPAAVRAAATPAYVYDLAEVRANAAALVAALAVAALLVTQTWAVAAICVVLLVAAWRAPVQRRWPYLFGALTSGASVVILPSTPTGVPARANDARTTSRPR